MTLRDRDIRIRRRRNKRVKLQRVVMEKNSDRTSEGSRLYRELHKKWLFAEWHELAQVRAEEIQNDARRGDIAVWVGVAHMQLEDKQTADRIFSLARDWGAQECYLENILEGLALQSLGRQYAACGKIDKALDVFHQALRLNVNTGQLAFEIDVWKKANEVSVNDRSKSKSEEESSLRESVRAEISNPIRPLQSFISVQNYLAHGYLIPIDSTVGTWSISPDLALVLTSLLVRENYDLIIEFGSGFSTELIARAIQKRECNSHGAENILQFAFEHSNEFYEKTKRQLTSAGVAEAVRLELASLKPWHGPNDEEYLYYDLDVIKTVMEELRLTPKRILVLVDGPPGNTSPYARYPALPIVNSLFTECEIDYLIDDYARPDEKIMVEKWKSLLSDLNCNYSVRYLGLEKGACFFRVSENSVSVDVSGGNV